MITKSGFRIFHSEGVVTVFKEGIVRDVFDAELYEANRLLQFFNSTDSNTWGCDGVGYGIQKDLGTVDVHKSTIGPRQFLKGIKRIQDNERNR